MAIQKLDRKELALIDTFLNAVNGFGNANSPHNLLSFTDGLSLDKSKMESLYRYDWLANRVVNAFPKEALKNGFKFNLEPEDELEMVSTLSELGFYDILFDALAYARLYGGSAIIVGALDGRLPAEEINKEAIANIAFLQVANRFELTPYKYYSDPFLPKFGQVEIFQYSPNANSGYANYLIHESRLIKINGSSVSKTQKMKNNMWDDSCLQNFYEANKTYSAAMHFIGDLLQDFTAKVWKLPDMAGYVADEANSEDTFSDRIKLMAKSLSNTGAIVLGENEEFNKLATPVTGLADLIKLIAQNASAGSGIPVSVLFGESFGQLSGAEMSKRTWNDEVAAYQNNIVRPVIEAIADFCLVNRSFPLDYESTEYAVEFNELFTPTPMEMLEMKKLQAEIDKINIEAGVLSPEEVREAYYGEYTFDRKADENADIQLNQPVEEPEEEKPKEE